MATTMDWQWDARAGLRYTNVAIWLHWLIALAILYNLTSGLLRPVLPRGFFAFHVSSGITILVLTVVRIGWRLTHRPPPMVAMAGWEKGLAHTVHFLLYAAMLLMPLSGWALISANPPADSPGAAWAAAHPAEPVKPAPAPAAGKPEPAPPPRKRGPTMIWGLFKLPPITSVNEVGRTAAGVPEQRALHERIESFHATGGWVLLALFLLHVAGALKHQLIDRQRELARMGLGRATVA